MQTLNQHNLATYMFSLAKYGIKHIEDKNSNLRDVLVEQQKSQVELCLNGFIDDEEIPEKCVSGILSVGKDIKDKTPSHTPEITKLVGILLEHIDKGKREKLIKKFALDAPSLYNKSNPIYEALASELMTSIRIQDCYRSDTKGAVSFNFKDKIK